MFSKIYLPARLIRSILRSGEAECPTGDVVHVTGIPNLMYNMFTVNKLS